jgi:hypothetical protein
MPAGGADDTPIPVIRSAARVAGATEPRGTLVLAVTPMSDLGEQPIRAAEAIREITPARRLLRMPLLRANEAGEAEDVAG